MNRRRIACTLFLALLACAGSVDTRPVDFYVAKSCPLPESAYVLLSGAGDFDSSASLGFLLKSPPAELTGIRSDSREILAAVTVGDEHWSGRTQAAAPISLALLPLGRPCALTSPVDARVGGSAAMLDARHLLLASGSGNPVPRSVVVDLATLTSAPVASDLLIPRVDATLAAFSGAAILAGGANAFTHELVASAEVFRANGFDRTLIPLSGPRTSAASVTLATGDVLLIGGKGANEVLLNSLERISTSELRAETAGLPLLDVPRTSPTALRLRNGEVLVLGGADSGGAVVQRLEWLNRDASGVAHRSRDLLLTAGYQAVPLGGGGALIVTPGTSRIDVWIIGEDGSLSAGAPLFLDPSSLQMVATTEGRAILFTSGANFSWDPWNSQFVPFFAAEKPPAGLHLATAPGEMVAIDGAQISIARYAEFSAYASFQEDLLLRDTASLAPKQSGGSFSPERGLDLQPGSGATVTDRRYADVQLDFETDASPIVELTTERGDIFLLGAADCLLPVTNGRVHVERAHGRITSPPGCASTLDPTVRVQIGFRADEHPANIRALKIRRSF